LGQHCGAALKEVEKRAKLQYGRIMENCKSERRVKSHLTNAEIAKGINVTENYVSTFENGRGIISFDKFLIYCEILGFDASILENLHISEKSKSNILKKENKELANNKRELIKRIYKMDQKRSTFLSKLFKLFDSKSGQSKKKLKLLDEIIDWDSDQLEYVIEHAKLSGLFKLKSKKMTK